MMTCKKNSVALKQVDIYPVTHSSNEMRPNIFRCGTVEANAICKQSNAAPCCRLHADQ